MSDQVLSITTVAARLLCRKAAANVVQAATRTFGKEGRLITAEEVAEMIFVELYTGAHKTD